MSTIKAPWIRKQRRTLTIKVSDTLKDAIRTGRLKPNEKLVESQLTFELGISRTPIRESLNRLEVEGYVKRLPSGGYAVVDLNLQRVRELCEVRQALEGYAARLACKRATEKQIKTLEQIQKKMNEAHKKRDIDSMQKLNGKFHTALCYASGNEQITARVQVLRGYFFSRKVLQFLSVNDWQESIAEHQQLINAIKKQECDSISKVMHNHIQRRIDFYAEHMST